MASRKKRPPIARSVPRAENDEALPRSHHEKMAHKPFSAALSNLKLEKPTRTKTVSRPETPKPSPSTIRNAPSSPQSAQPPAPRPAPRGNELSHHSYEDRVSFREAMRGVRPLGQAEPKRKKKKGVAVPRVRIEPEKRRDPDAEAMAQLDALVEPDYRYRFEKDGSSIRALRVGAHLSHLSALAEAFVPEASLDLHGLRGDDAERAILQFVRAKHQEGKRQLLIIHGRGKGSAGGAGILVDVAVDTLSRTGLSKIVLAFASAPRHLGGAGALVVRLGER